MLPRSPHAEPFSIEMRHSTWNLLFSVGYAVWCSRFARSWTVRHVWDSHFPFYRIHKIRNQTHNPSWLHRCDILRCLSVSVRLWLVCVTGSPSRREFISIVHCRRSDRCTYNITFAAKERTPFSRKSGSRRPCLFPKHKTKVNHIQIDSFLLCMLIKDMERSAGTICTRLSCTSLLRATQKWSESRKSHTR